MGKDVQEIERGKCNVGVQPPPMALSRTTFSLELRLMKRLFEESELVSGDSEDIRKFSDKYIVPEKLVAEFVEHLAQIKMRKEKKKKETERDRMERLKRQYNDIDWAGLYNSDKLLFFRVDELSLYVSHHKITFKGKKS